jgi:hypothetical protein
MRALKICLWISGIACLLSAIGMFLPCSILCAIVRAFGIETTTDSPLLEYGARTTLATYFAIGVYLVILAMDPMKYGILVPFTGVAAVFIGVVCGITGLAVAMPLLWVLGDFVSCTVLGVLILVFWQQAKQAS